jgi:hypothetical protein
MPTGQCRLCQAQAELQLSHVLPAFVYRWLRTSSGNGHIRGSDKPNRRVQDGLKLYWLCSRCEGLLSVSEGEFANKLFLPYTNGTKKSVRYSSWLMHFCTSLSWRVLRFYFERNEWDGWSADSIARMNEAETVWREVLLKSRPHPGLLQQHILPLDQIESTTGSFAPNINRYLMRAIQMDLCRSNKAIYTYAKLGRFIVLGFVHEPNLGHWRGTKVHANEGVIEPRQYVVPGVLGDYLNEKARKMSEALRSMSEAQQGKVDLAFRENVDRYIGSDAFTAMRADVEMFGDATFSKK